MHPRCIVLLLLCSDTYLAGLPGKTQNTFRVYHQYSRRKVAVRLVICLKWTSSANIFVSGPFAAHLLWSSCWVDLGPGAKEKNTNVSYFLSFRSSARAVSAYIKFIQNTYQKLMPHLDWIVHHFCYEQCCCSHVRKNAVYLATEQSSNKFACIWIDQISCILFVDCCFFVCINSSFLWLWETNCQCMGGRGGSS